VTERCARGAPLIRDRHRPERSRVCSAPRLLFFDAFREASAALRCARDVQLKLAPMAASGSALRRPAKNAERAGRGSAAC